MIHTKKRMILCLSLIAFNVVFIWGNSLLTREVSSAISHVVGKILSFFISGPLTPAEGQGHGILRKIAHVTEFCTLGMLLSWLLRMQKRPTWCCYVIPVSIGLAVAAIDETIQYFVPGRGPGIGDVAIDTVGALLGTVLLAFLAFLVSRRKVKQ